MSARSLKQGKTHTPYTKRELIRVKTHPLSQQATRGTGKIRKIGLAQQALTNGERTVYDALWRVWTRANPNSKSYPPSIVVTMGFKRLASETALHHRSCRQSTDGLLSKYVVDVISEEVSETRTGRTYRVYSYEECRKRWIAKGLTHFIKKGGGGVALCTAEGTNLTGVGYKIPNRTKQLTPPTRGESHPVSSAEDSRPVVGQDSHPDQGDESHPRTGSDLHPPSDGFFSGGSLDVKQQQTASPSFINPAAIYNVLARFAQDADHGAVYSLIARCQENLSDITESELIEALLVKGDQVIQSESVRNPIAVLLKAVPEWVADPAFQSKRESLKRRREEAEKKRKEETITAAVREKLRQLPRNNRWEQVKSELQKTVNPHSFDTWIRPVLFGGERDGAVLLWVPTVEFKTVTEKYEAEIADASAKLAEPVREFRCLTTEELYSTLIQ